MRLLAGEPDERGRYNDPEFSFEPASDVGGARRSLGEALSTATSFGDAFSSSSLQSPHAGQSPTAGEEGAEEEAGSYWLRPRVRREPHSDDVLALMSRRRAMRHGDSLTSMIDR